MIDKELRIGKVDNKYVELEGTDFYAVDFLPYKIKNRELFYHRDHPKDLNPYSMSYKKYWDNHITNCIEGKWIFDVAEGASKKDGTWIFMPPKLYFYINTVPIIHKGKQIPPILMDNEWLMAYYYFCMNGFSGFSEDPTYTSCDIVKTIEDGKELSYIENQKLKEIEPNILNVNGRYKRYVDPWVYLTEHYLINDNRGKPLGKPLYDNEKKNGINLAARTSHKAISPDELVRVKNGWTKIKDLNVGDQVYGSDGKLTNVTNVTDLQKDLNFYKITFRDGREIECCEDHMWKVYKYGEVLELTTKEILEDYKISRIDSMHKIRTGKEKQIFEYKYSVPNCKALTFEDEKECYIHPYIIGVLLGDGCITGSTAASFTSNDEEICDKVQSLLPEGYTLNKRLRKNNSHYLCSIIRENNNLPTFNTLLEDLGLLGTKSHNKFIPHQYLYNSLENRLELLKGLNDTDGSINSNGSRILYTTVSEQLSSDYQNLCRSVGVNTKTVEKESFCHSKGAINQCRNSFLTYCYPDKSVFYVERKLSRQIPYDKSSALKKGKIDKNYIVDIQPIGKKDGVCITVDNEDSTYITKDYIVTHNSYNAMLQYFLHEHTFNSARTFKELKDVNKKRIFGLASLDKDPLERSIGLISDAISNLPGKYKAFPKYGGSLYKNTSGGSWKLDNTIQHNVQRKNRTDEILGNIVQIKTIKPKNATVFSGDRFSAILFEEVGFIPHLKEIISAIRNSLKVDNTRIGSWLGLGTGGKSEAIGPAKDIFENPDGYEVVGLPNWYNKANPNKNIGLFISYIYTKEEYKDEQGNTKIKEALTDIVRERIENKKTMDANSFISEINFNPLYPKEIVLPKTRSRFPVAEMADHKQSIIDKEYILEDSTEKLFSTKNMRGWLEWDQTYKTGVRFDLDLHGDLEEIINWGKEDKYASLKGAFMIYEDVMEDAPDGLYHVLLDPVAHSGKGSSLVSVLVYKADYIGAHDGMRDNIVAEWTGKLQELPDIHEMIIKISRYYNSAKIFVERNVSNFLEYCRDNNYMQLLHMEPVRTLQLIQKQVRPSYWNRGVRMNKPLNDFAYLELASWFKKVTKTDDDGLPLRKKLHEIKSLRLIDEAINYDPDQKTHFDGISSLYLLMLLRTELKEQQLVVSLQDEDEDYETGNYKRYKYNQETEKIIFLDY